MNICIIHRYPISLLLGTNPSFNLFLDKLISSGHKVFFISFRENDSRFVRYDIYHYQINVDFNRTNFKDKLFKSLWFSCIVPFIILKLHKKNHLDLVYADDSFPFYGYLIKKITKLKTFIRLGDLQTAYTFWGESFVKQVIFNIVFSIEKKTWKAVDKIIAISNAFKDFIIKNGIPKEKVEVVRECIDLNMFNSSSDGGLIRRQYNIGDSPLLVFHGLLAKIKGLDILIKAVPLLIKEIPQIKIMIVGSGSELTHLKNMAYKLGVKDNVVFTGWVDFDKIKDYISAADIGLALRSDNLGNNFVITTALLQYWAMKKAVISPQFRAFKDIIEEGRNGFLFNPNDYKELAKKIISVMTDRSLLDQIGIAGYNTARENFNIELIANNMVKILIGNK